MTRLAEVLTELLHRRSVPANLLAREAGVANRTMTAVLNAQYANDPPPSLNPEICTRSQLRGYVTSLISLAKFAELPVEATLCEYGIDPAWPSVSVAISTLTPRNTKRIVTDTLESVRSDGVVVVGVLSWWSLFPDGPDNRVETSWAARYVRTLLGCLNPSLRVEFRRFDDVREGIESLLAAPPEIHLLVGVSDTSFRRLQGLEFVNLPGIGVPISALAFAPAESRLTFEDFLGLPDNYLALRNIQFITLADEVGDIFLRSHLNNCLGSTSVTRLEINDPSSLSKTLLELASDIRTNLVFVADAVTTGRVEQEIQRTVVQMTSRLSSSMEPNELMRISARNKHFIKSDAWPIYPLSIAVPQGASDWCEILKRCQREELFSNQATLTSILYEKLLTSEDRFSPLPLTSQLTPSAAEHFCNLLSRAVNSHSEDSISRTKSHRIQRFLSAWQPSNRSRGREPIYSDEYLSILTAIERKILTGEPGFQPNSIVTSGDIIHVLEPHRTISAQGTQLSQSVNASADVCKYWILPALASVGLLEEKVKGAENDLSSFSPASFSGVYSVPGLPEGSPRAGRWMFWERYHCEVVFACLIGSKTPEDKSYAISCIQNKLEHAETLIRRRNKDFGHVADLVLSDREFHLSVCHWGSPDGRPETTIRNLERAFNRLNAALPPGTAKGRFSDNFQQHSRILDAIRSSGSLPVLEDYKKILNAYATHFFRLRKDYLAVDEDFLTKLESSVLREVAALEHISWDRFFQQCRCQILRSRNVLPLEWIDGGRDRDLVTAIAHAVKGGATIHYVILGAPADAESVFSKFIERMQAVLHEDIALCDQIRTRVFWFSAEGAEQTAFVSSLFEDQAEACLVYGDSECRSIQLTRRRKNIDSDGPGEMRRKIDATEMEKRRFMEEYLDFLRTLSNGSAGIAITKISLALEAVGSILSGAE